MITKSDYLLYKSNPLHFWASKHAQMEISEPADFALFLMEQGKTIEEPAEEYITECLARQVPRHEILWQPTYVDGEFQIRADAVILDLDEGVYDLVEVKSSVNLKPEHKYDVTFQALVFEAHLPLRNIYIVHLNKDYIRQGEVDLRALFTADLLNEDVEKLREEVRIEREEAARIAALETHESLEGCRKPKDCICPSLCHPNLPENPIYQIPRIGKKALDLKALGILAIENIPAEYKLSARQRQEVQMVKTGQPIINQNAILEELENLQFPLYFLDYETFNPGIPLFDGFHPYQHIVFQYSLHRLDSPNGELEHDEFLSAEATDPEPALLEHLARDVGDRGSIIVWNQAFECGRNREMAVRHPDHAAFLADINERTYDLMVIFQNHYLHPDFKGSASIKNVLPVLAPDLSYQQLQISEGTQAMLAWSRLNRGELSEPEQKETIRDLLKYCALDSLAMVEIWRVLQAIPNRKI